MIALLRLSAYDRRIEGFVENEDVYAALGRTYAGRYLAVFFVYKPATATAIIISARHMTPKERKWYGKK